MFTSNSRPLRWPLTNTLTPVAQTPDNGDPQLPFTWPTTDNDEMVSIILTLSLNEYVGLASAVDVGRDIAYGDDSEWIWWIWNRSANTLPICDQIIDCIENDPATGQAIINYLIQTGAIDPDTVDADNTTVNDRMTSSQQNSDVNTPPDECDLDILWAGIFEIVTRLDENARTVLEQALVINDIAQRYQSLIQAIPIIGDAASSLTKQFTEFIPDIYNSFNAYSSQENMETLACALFELVCADCKYPTFEQLANTIAAQAFPLLLDWQTVNLTVVLSQFIQTGSFTPSLVWHSMLLFELIVLYFQATWNNNKASDVITFWALLGEDNPSDDWMLLCDECNPEVFDAYYQEFMGSLGDYTIQLGTLTSGGITSVANGQPENINVYLHSATAWNLTGYEVTYRRSSDGSANDDFRIIGWTDINAGTGRVDLVEINEPAHAEEDRTLCNAFVSNTNNRNDWGFYFRDNTAGSPITFYTVKVWSDSPLPNDLTMNAIGECS